MIMMIHYLFDDVNDKDVTLTLLYDDMVDCVLSLFISIILRIWLIVLYPYLYLGSEEYGW